MIAATALVAVGGCHEGPTVAAVKQSQRGAGKGVGQTDALLKAAATQLNDLPSAVDIETRPPQIVLDSRKSSDRQDVYAICKANPDLPGNPVNKIIVPAGNSRFRSLGVHPGDVLKFFVLQDQTVDKDSQESGLSRQKAMPLTIAKVLDDNTLLIDSSLNQEVDFLVKIEVWRNLDDRLADINNKLGLYVNRRLPALAWEPTPDDTVLGQVLTWLNQWIRQSSPPDEWKRDGLLDTLPAELAADATLAPYISLSTPEGLTAKSFPAHEGRIIQEAIWLRDISRWAHGDAFDDVGRAEALFDWTIRNIQLESDVDTPPHRPWHTLIYGQGTADQRAWVFAELCRQQGLTVVMVGVPLNKSGAAKSGAPQPDDKSSSPSDLDYWLPALFSKGQLYLFDTRLGLAIASSDGKGVATLDEVVKDDSLLRKFDLEGTAYPITSELAKGAQIFIVADPFQLTRRASQLESSLSGEDHLALAAKPTELATQLKSVPGAATASLWAYPFKTLRDQLNLGKPIRLSEALAFEPFAVRPALWKARTRHFQGRHKPATEPGGEAIDDHQEAARFYMSKAVRPPDREFADLPSTDRQAVIASAKLNAAYWLGLLSYDDGKFDVAAEWFARPELSKDTSPWKTGAHYNIARSLEAQDKIDEAIPMLSADKSPQEQGDKLRAARLKARPPAAKSGESAK
ncbi:MAG TPA: hypothetical protein VHU84_08265 [Lacipirellulaceae bacterium]|nr:hypothetical protein [Lacipirellulaceae bacterium]